MSVDESEYEVESITKARLEKAKGRKKGGLSWKYQVRWKGYSANDDTWEPVESFIGSEHFVQHFWERANTNGRDYKNTNLFQVGEEFFPTGPPRRKDKRKSQNSGVSPSQRTSPVQSTEEITILETPPGLRKRGISIEEISKHRPAKRPREDLPLSGVQTSPLDPDPLSPGFRNKSQLLAPRQNLQRPPPKRSSSFDEIIPASDEENDPSSEEPTGSHPSHIPISDSERLHDSSSKSGVIATDKPLPVDMEVTQTLHSAESPAERSLKIPSHRARAMNPRVKIVNDSNMAEMDGAITVKARLMGRGDVLSSSTSAMSRKGSKPGPGRSSSGFLKKNKSSLLTFEKGVLKTRKGRFCKPSDEEKVEEAGILDSRDSTPTSLFGDLQDNDEIPSDLTPVVPPTAEELLVLAGARDSTLNPLPDFEDDDPTVSQIAESAPQLDPASEIQIDLMPEPAQSALQRSLTLAKDKLFPAGVAAGISGLATSWRASTIFGPLGLGTNSLAKPSGAESNQLAEALAFSLNIDPSVCIPVLLTDASPGSLSLPVNAGKKGPPGKFYSQESTLSLLNTLRTGGPSAKLELNPDSTDEQKKQYESFCTRLDAGEIFVAMAGAEVLVFCSSTHPLICQRLNISPVLIGKTGDMVVTRVIIENYSDYAALALKEARD